jgi:ribosomal protein S18 acetylase RimI-like enzyme
VRPLRPGEADRCEALMRALPGWFGIEASILAYRRDVETLESWGVDVDGELAAFLTLRAHNAHSAEIQVLAVHPAHHRRGFGRALVAHAAALLRQRDVAFLQVKTLGPSRPSDEYAATRAFYRAVGFLPLEENHLWGDVNPCLILVRHLACEAAPDHAP